MTQYYVGVKLVEAWEETRNNELGYAVKYPDGYVSWSPKKAFEDAYLCIGGAESSKINSWVVDAFIVDRFSLDFDEKTTLVKAKLATGFTMIEHSSCVDPDNYDPNLGETLCMEAIKSKVWNYLGFVLQWAKFGLNK